MTETHTLIMRVPIAIYEELRRRVYNREARSMNEQIVRILSDALVENQRKTEETMEYRIEYYSEETQDWEDACRDFGAELRPCETEESALASIEQWETARHESMGDSAGYERTEWRVVTA